MKAHVLPPTPWHWKPLVTFVTLWAQRRWWEQIGWGWLWLLSPLVSPCPGVFGRWVAPGGKVGTLSTTSRATITLGTAGCWGWRCQGDTAVTLR